MQEIRRDRQGLTKGAGTGPGTRYHRSQVVQVTGRQVTGRLSLRRTGRCRSCGSLFSRRGGSGAPHTVQYVGATKVKGIEVGGRPHIVLFSGEISARTRCSRRCCVSAMLPGPSSSLHPAWRCAQCLLCRRAAPGSTKSSATTRKLRSKAALRSFAQPCASCWIHLTSHQLWQRHALSRFAYAWYSR